MINDRLKEIWERWQCTVGESWKEDTTDEGFEQVIDANTGEMVCGIGDLEDTTMQDHFRAKFIAHAPEDMAYLLRLVKHYRDKEGK